MFVFFFFASHAREPSKLPHLSSRSILKVWRKSYNFFWHVFLWLSVALLSLCVTSSRSFRTPTAAHPAVAAPHTSSVIPQWFLHLQSKSESDLQRPCSALSYTEKIRKTTVSATRIRLAAVGHLASFPNGRSISQLLKAWKAGSTRRGVFATLGSVFGSLQLHASNPHALRPLHDGGSSHQQQPLSCPWSLPASHVSPLPTENAWSTRYCGLQSQHLQMGGESEDEPAGAATGETEVEYAGFTTRLRRTLWTCVQSMRQKKFRNIFADLAYCKGEPTNSPSGPVIGGPATGAVERGSPTSLQEVAVHSPEIVGSETPQMPLGRIKDSCRCGTAEGAAVSGVGRVGDEGNGLSPRTYHKTQDSPQVRHTDYEEKRMYPPHKQQQTTALNNADDSAGEALADGATGSADATAAPLSPAVAAAVIAVEATSADQAQRECLNASGTCLSGPCADAEGGPLRPPREANPEERGDEATDSPTRGSLPKEAAAETLARPPALGNSSEEARMNQQRQYTPVCGRGPPAATKEGRLAGPPAGGRDLVALEVSVLQQLLLALKGPLQQQTVASNALAAFLVAQKAQKAAQPTACIPLPGSTPGDPASNVATATTTSSRYSSGDFAVEHLLNGGLLPALSRILSKPTPRPFWPRWLQRGVPSSATQDKQAALQQLQQLQLNALQLLQQLATWGPNVEQQIAHHVGLLTSLRRIAAGGEQWPSGPAEAATAEGKITRAAGQRGGSGSAGPLPASYEAAQVGSRPVLPSERDKHCGEELQEKHQIMEGPEAGGLLQQAGPPNASSSPQQSGSPVAPPCRSRDESSEERCGDSKASSSAGQLVHTSTDEHVADRTGTVSHAAATTAATDGTAGAAAHSETKAKATAEASARATEAALAAISNPLAPSDGDAERPAAAGEAATGAASTTTECRADERATGDLLLLRAAAEGVARSLVERLEARRAEGGIGAPLALQEAPGGSHAVGSPLSMLRARVSFLFSFGKQRDGEGAAQTRTSVNTSVATALPNPHRMQRQQQQWQRQPPCAVAIVSAAATTAAPVDEAEGSSGAPIENAAREKGRGGGLLGAAELEGERGEGRGGLLGLGRLFAAWVGCMYTAARRKIGGVGGHSSVLQPEQQLKHKVLWMPLWLDGAGSGGLWATIAAAAGEAVAAAMKEKVEQHLRQQQQQRQQQQEQEQQREQQQGTLHAQAPAKQRRPLPESETEGELLRLLEDLRLGTQESGGDPQSGTWGVLGIAITEEDRTRNSRHAYGRGQYRHHAEGDMVGHDTDDGNRRSRSNSRIEHPLAGSVISERKVIRFKPLALLTGPPICHAGVRQHGSRLLLTAAAGGQYSSQLGALKALTLLVRQENPEVLHTVAQELRTSCTSRNSGFGLRRGERSLDEGLAAAVRAPYKSNGSGGTCSGRVSFWRVGAREGSDERERLELEEVQLAVLRFLYELFTRQERLMVPLLQRCVLVRDALQQVVSCCSSQLSRAAPAVPGGAQAGLGGPAADFKEGEGPLLGSPSSSCELHCGALRPLPPADRQKKVSLSLAGPLRLATVVSAGVWGPGQWRPRRPGQRGLRILALDGGGTRGVLTVALLKEIAAAVGGDLSSAFDIICGTSTGGVLAVLLGLERATASELEALYDALIKEIFVKDAPAVAGARLVMRQAYYDETLWESILLRAFGQARMIDFAADTTIPKVFCLSTNVSTNPARLIIWRNYNYPTAAPAATSLRGPSQVEQGTSSAGLGSPFWHSLQQQLLQLLQPVPAAAMGGHNQEASAPAAWGVGRYEGSCCVFVRDALRATTAAPGFFSGKIVGGETVIDGALLANNPAAVAVSEARALYPQVPIEVFVSVGTGQCAVERCTEKMGWDGVFSQLVGAATNTEAVHGLLQDLLPPTVYFRFNPVIGNLPIDETDTSKLEGLKRIAQLYANQPENKAAIQRLARILRPSLPLHKRCQGLLHTVRKRAKGAAAFIISSAASFMHRALNQPALTGPFTVGESALFRVIKCCKAATPATNSNTRHNPEVYSNHISTQPRAAAAEEGSCSKTDGADGCRGGAPQPGTGTWMGTPATAGVAEGEATAFPRPAAAGQLPAAGRAAEGSAAAGCVAEGSAAAEKECPGTATSAAAAAAGAASEGLLKWERGWGVAGSRRSFFAWLANIPKTGGSKTQQQNNVFDALELLGKRQVSAAPEVDAETLVPLTGVRHVLQGIFQRIQANL